MKELTERDIKSVMGKFHIRDKPPTGALIFISVDWCGHCKRAKPELQKVAGITGTGFPIYKIDGDKNKSLVSKMGISGFPTIRYVLPNGQIDRDYTGERTKGAILKDICERAKKCYNN